MVYLKFQTPLGPARIDYAFQNEKNFRNLEDSIRSSKSFLNF